MGKLTEAVRRLVESLQISSASPGHINEVLQLDPSIDLDEVIEDNEVIANETKRTDKIQKTLEGFDKGNVGEIQRLSSQHFGNITEFARNPFTFITGTVFRKFAKGAGILALAAVIFEAVKYIISELLKPGRFLDIRFRRNTEEELLAFRRREDQQKLKQGFSNIIITTMPRLRGGQGQVYNTLDRVRLGTFPANIGQSNVQLLASGVSVSKNKGAGRRNFSAGVG